MNQDSLSKNTSKTFLKGAMIMTVSMVVVKLLGMFYKIFLYRMFATYDDIAGFSMSKGTARFPLADDPRDLHGLPLDLVARMAQWCLREEPAERAAAPHGEKGAPRQRRPMPDYVREALEAASLMDAYLARPPYQRNDYLGWITRPKREATRRAHLTQMLDELARGDVYMKMPWHGPGARTESVG